jgi:hypothetical protein
MQSTKSNQAFSSVYSNPAVTSKASSPDLSEGKGIDRSFVIACGLGAVTIVFGVTALIYQFAPEFNRLRNASSQVEVSRFSAFQG